MKKLIWPMIVLVCAFAIAASIHYGIMGSHRKPANEGHLLTSSSKDSISDEQRQKAINLVKGYELSKGLTVEQMLYKIIDEKEIKAVKWEATKVGQESDDHYRVGFVYQDVSGTFWGWTYDCWVDAGYVKLRGRDDKEQQATMSDYDSLTNKRDLSTPSARLVGHWRSIDNGDLYFDSIDRALRIGTFRLVNLNNPPIQFKVISEDVLGEHIVIRDFRDLSELEFALKRDCSVSDIDIYVSKDGQRMTQECVFLGKRFLSVYHYVDNKTLQASSILGSATSDGPFDPAGTITGIALGDNPSAVVGSRIIHKGDIIGDALVVGIEDGKVHFEKNGKTWTQGIGDQVLGYPR